MAQTLTLLHVLTAIQLSVFAGMFATLVWGLRELREGRSLLPVGSARDVPWNGFDVFGVILLWIVVNVAAGLAIIPPNPGDSSKTTKTVVAKASEDAPATSGKIADSTPRSLIEPMLAMTCINAILLVLAPIFLRLSSGATLAQIGFSTNDLARNIQLGIRTFLFATPFVYLVFILAQLIWRPNKHPIELMMMKEMSPGVVLLGFFSAVIFAPLAEELMFRSVIQGWLIRRFRKEHETQPVNLVERGEPHGIWVGTTDREIAGKEFDNGSGLKKAEPAEGLADFLAIALTSAIFAIMHAPQMPAPVPLFALSMVLGALARRTGSLVPSVVVHSLFNGLSMLGLLIQTLTPAQ